MCTVKPLVTFPWRKLQPLQKKKRFLKDRIEQKNGVAEIT